MNATALAFELDDTIVKRPSPAVAHPVVEASEDSVTGVAGIALWGELVDHLGLVGECDRRSLRPIGPGGYTGGECYRAVVETQLAGGDFLSDRSLLADEAQNDLLVRRQRQESIDAKQGPDLVQLRRPRAAASTTDPANRKTTYGYDKAGNLTPAPAPGCGTHSAA